MPSYQLDPAGFPELRRKVLLRAVPTTGLTILVAHFIWQGQNSRNVGDDGIYWILLPVIIGAMSFGFVIALKRQKRMWDSYRIELSDTGIARSSQDLPFLEISKGDIREIVETRTGDLHIKTGDRLKRIYIPANVEDREDLLVQLAGFGNITKKPEPNYMLLTVLSFVVTMGLMYLFYTSTNRDMVLISGGILVIGLMWCFLEIRRNPNVDRRVKSTSYLTLIVVTAFLIRMVIIITE